MFGEEYNKKFLDELNKTPSRKRCRLLPGTIPSKDELMGDNLRPTYDTLVGTINMGRGAESTKQVDNIAQHGPKK